MNKLGIVDKGFPVLEGKKGCLQGELSEYKGGVFFVQRGVTAQGGVTVQGGVASSLEVGMGPIYTIT